MTDKYDSYFKLWASIYFNDLVDWPWFKSQGITESGLDPNVVSPAGAIGIMQLMPGTIKDMGKELLMLPDPYDPETNIHLGIRYDKKMWNIFKKEVGLERLRFMLGAFNAGAEHIIDAQKLTDRPNLWKAVSHKLSEVTGESNSLQTINYVKRVESNRLQIIFA